MFDDFMEELHRREAARAAADGQPKPGPDEGADGQPKTGPDEGADEGPSNGGSREDEAMRSDGSGSDDTDRDEDRPEPSPIFRRGARGGRFRRYPGGPPGEFPEFHLGRRWIVLGLVVLALFVLLPLFMLFVGLATDAIWFQSIGYSNVFWTRVGSQILIFVAGGVISFLVLWVNLWLAGRFIPKGQLRRFSLDDLLDRFNVDRYFGGGTFGSGPFGTPPSRTVKGEAVAVPDIGRPVFWSLLAFALLVGLAMGGLALGGWNTIQLFLHRVPFGQTDPIFGKDIGFFMFELPFYRLIQSAANSLLLIALVLVGIRYLIAVVSGASMPTAARVHLGLLAALWLWSAAVGYQLDRYELVYSNTSGIFQGVSYSDYNAKMLAINVMTVLTAFIGCFVVAFSYTRWRTPLALTLIFWAGAFLILDVGYPQLVQRFSVVPNQQAQESPYITDNITETRLAFDLTGWSTTQYTPESDITPAAVQAESSTIQNVRLWDISPLSATLDGLQVLRQYYTFPEVATDRYVFTDAQSCAPSAPPCVRQVMLAGRELDPTQLAQLTQGDQSWVNQHITYTHGYGLVMVPVNEVGQSGQPNLLISNFPPVSTAGAPTVTQPRIYFGTTSSNYVIVDAASQEFDYPSATGTGGDQYTTWTGTTGIKLDTPLARLLFAAKFGDLNMLISSQITGSSQLLYNRSIQERAEALAPFLRFDKDPYLVVTSSGRLDYVLDAYTTSAAFPDSNLYDPGTDPSVSGLAGDPFNYVRNSVKIVMDAYDGTMSFYVADPNDPIIQAWQGVFPSLFKPMSDMPVDIRGDATNPGHLRYPEDIFNAQTYQFAKYHVTDPSVFYQGNDVWQLPPSADTGGSTGTQQLGLQAYYVQMRVPGQTNPEFVLLQPMVPQGRQNMIAWVAAHNDPAAYGQVSVFDFPRQSNVFGPQQIEALIAQNKDISQQITLWGQVGSNVILGNLLVIPLQNSLMYVEPVYLKASSNGLPVFQKVIIGTQTQIVWGNTLQDALTQIYAGQGTTGPGGSPSPGTSATPSPPAASPSQSGTPTALPSVSLSGTAQQLISEANAHYQAAQAALHNGDLATYQQEMNIVGQLLTQLEAVLGTPAPSGS
ncbi:MAG: UPF0182 family protein [Candidatus Limnocylindrales bacterium]|jgi:hypothetical protein